MSIIEEYLDDIKRVLDEIPFELSRKVQAENRGDVALYLKGKIVFTGGSELHFKEYFIAIPILKKLAYSYHYQNKNKEVIFRFDNAEHYLEVKTYPHHKHLNDVIFPSKEASLKEILTKILNTLTKSKSR